MVGVEVPKVWLDCLLFVSFAVTRDTCWVPVGHKTRLRLIKTGDLDSTRSSIVLKGTSSSCMLGSQMLSKPKYSCFEESFCAEHPRITASLAMPPAIQNLQKWSKCFLSSLHVFIVHYIALQITDLPIACEARSSGETKMRPESALLECQGHLRHV